MSPPAAAHTSARCPSAAPAEPAAAGASWNAPGVSARPTTVVIAAGGTAGHVVPALAVARALRAEGAEVAFVGAERAEAQLVPDAGFALHAIPVEGLSRSNPLRALVALARAALATVRARAILRALRPDAVMGAGGYVAGPVVLAALTRRTPVLLTEADSKLGLTNRLLAPFARRVCLAFPPRGRVARARGRNPRKYLVTGRPVPLPAQDRAASRARLGLAEGMPLVVVFGGSLGARSINEAAVEAFSRGVAELGTGDARVLHVCGRRDFEALAARPRGPGYELVGYLDLEDFARALAAADLVVARAGGSIFEVAAYGVPAVLVPYPYAAGDHQAQNARWMTDAGAAITIADRDLTPARLRAEVTALLGDRERLEAMSRASHELARPRAALDVAHELMEIARP
jgi:UDP-N-acetylglucosamine--N-acetylmuramyl-(pentapeptide) pyrophosphoryl-undecaprenol N-acetylglucosamine transferase